MLFALSASAALAVVAASPTVPAASPGVPVAIGNFKTASLPPLTKVERVLPHWEMTKRVQAMLATRQCDLQGQRPERFDLTVPYAIKLDSAGKPSKVVVHETGCRPLSMLVAQIVVAQAARGDFKMKPGAAEQWFGSDVYFKMGEPTAFAAMANPDKVSCKAFPVVGSRVRVNRVCKTAAEWAVYDKDRQELGRDLRNAGECVGGGSNCQ